MKKNKTPLPDEERLSAEELSLLKNLEDRSTREPYDTSERAATARFLKRNPLLVISAVIILLALVASAVLGVVLFLRAQANKPSTDDFSLVLGESEPTRIAYTDWMQGGVLFLDMKKLAAFADMVVVGSDERIKFVSDDHYLRFEDGSENAVVNGLAVAMPAPASVSADKCLVPYSFLQKVISQGITIHWEQTTNVITVKRQRYSDNGEPAELRFVTDGFEILYSLKKVSPTAIDPSRYPFDIAPYLRHINPTNSAPYLVLANKKNALDASYVPESLVVLESLGIQSKDANQKLSSTAAYALQAMLLAMEKEAPDAIQELYVTSSYRSYEYQHKLYYDTYVARYLNQGYSQEEAERLASEFSARPGESEHQTGLCLDFVINGEALDEHFEETAAFRWLSENAHLYGFILRYPKGMQGITGYTYEPWHYRFVGRDAAVVIHDGDLTLEEYLG